MQADNIFTRLFSRVSIPNGAVAVRPFDTKKYLGTWYEIARLDFRFERGLTNVTANYSLDNDTRIRVVNRGYDQGAGKWKTSVGKARLAGLPDEGKLKVSFFGPFYAGYNIIALDPQYRFALIAGNNTSYLWLLSREKTMPERVRDNYLRQAEGLGYKTAGLVWTRQD